MARITIVGAGYVGLCTGVVFAKHGHDVTLVDLDAAKVAAIREGRAPFYEPGLEDALSEGLAAGRLTATTDLATAVRDSAFSFLCVGTPRRDDGSADLKYIREAASQIGALLQDRDAFHVVITKSTVPPGTAEDVVKPALEQASGKRVNEGFGVASNPEFLKEGSAMKDALHPDRIVVGASSPEVADRVWTLYEAFSCPKLTTDPRTSETIKYAANAFLALKVGFSNELANVCERLGVDWYQVAEGIGHDVRINPHFLRAGAGFGGSCFPKDVAALRHLAREAGSSTGILDAVLAGNETQPLETVRMLKEEIGALDGKRIALLGLAFKPDTDDVRETRALPILRALEAEGARVVCHDPKAQDTFRALAPDYEVAKSPEDALRDADGCIVQTEWAEYRTLAPDAFRHLMRTPVVIDGRRTFEPAGLQEAGVRYRGIGLGRAREAPPS